MPAVSPFRRLLLPVSLLLVGVFLAPGAARSQTPAKPAAAGSPPVIDRELFFGNPEIAGAQLSPDGQFIAFIKPYKETRNVWVKKTSEPFSAAKLITADTKRPIPGYFWSRDSKYILFVQDQAGDENYNVYAVNPADSPAAGQDAPAARNLTDRQERARASSTTCPGTSPTSIYVGLNDRDAAWHDLYKVKISTGERTLLRKNTEKIARLDLRQHRTTSAGRPHRRQRRHRDPARRRRRLQEDLFVHRLRELRSGPLPQGRQARLPRSPNKGEPNLIRPRCCSIRTRRTEEFVESDPLKRVDLGDARFSDRTDEIARDVLRGRAEAPVFQGQGVRGGLQRRAEEAARQGESASGRPRRTNSCGSSAASERQRAR